MRSIELDPGATGQYFITLDAGEARSHEQTELAGADGAMAQRGNVNDRCTATSNR